MTEPAEQTCGQEMAASAEVPLRWQQLMAHVASNMEVHAAWVGVASPAAAREREALLAVAEAALAAMDHRDPDAC